MKHLKMPDNIRKEYTAAAGFVWNYIAGDCPEAEGYSTRTIVEIIRDANRIRTADQMGARMSKEFQVWIEEHEYDPAYGRDMNAAVKDAV